MGLGSWLAERAEDVAGVADDAWDATTEVASDAWDATTDAASDVWDATTDAADDAWDATTEAASDAWGAVTRIPGNVSDAYGGIVRWVINLVDLRDAAGHFDKAAADFMEIKSRLVPIPSSGLPPQLEGMVGGEVRAIGTQLEAFAEFLRLAAKDLRARADAADMGMLSSFTTPWSFQSGWQKVWTVVDVATTIIPVGLLAKGAAYTGKGLLYGFRTVNTFRKLDRYDRVLDIARTLDRLGPRGQAFKARLLKDWDEFATGLAHARAVGQKLYHYAPHKNLKRIRKKGLKRGSYLSPDGDLSPLQAHIDLALPGPAQRDTIIRVNIEAMKRDGYRLPSLRPVKRDFGMAGGGTEALFPYRIPKRYIKVIKG